MSRRPEPRFDWFIPIDGDGAHIGTRRAERPPTFEYLRRVVETAEAEGYYSLLIPTRFANGLFEETAPLAETWTTVTALAAVTRRIRFLVARSEEHTSELQSRGHLVCRLLLEKKK